MSIELSKTVAVTGGGGLVGSSLVGGTKLTRADGDLCNLTDTMVALEHPNPRITAIIHAAAKVGGVLGNLNHSLEFFQANTAINLNILEAAANLGIKRILCCSSTCVFPDDRLPIKEEYMHEGPPPSFHSGYAYAKRIMDIAKDEYNKAGLLNAVTVYFVNLFGPNDSFDPVNGHVTPSLIRSCYLAKKTNTPFVVWGTGLPLREFVYVKDLATILPTILNSGTCEDMIISSGEEYRIRDLAIMIADAFKFRGQIVYDISKPVGQYRKPTDNTRFRKIMPDFKFTPVQQGIEETVNWFLENAETDSIRGLN